MSIIKLIYKIFGLEYISLEDRIEAIEQYIAEREGDL